MSTIKLKGNEIHTAGTLPSNGTVAPDFKLAKTDLSDVSLKDFAGKKILLNIFPSIDTGICAASARRFNKEASSIPNTVVVCVSKDLPFAHKRFCEAEGLTNVVAASAIRNDSFEKGYHVQIIDGPMAGLLSRAVVVIGEDGKVKYSEQVPEIVQEPDYEAALNALK